MPILITVSVLVGIFNSGCREEDPVRTVKNPGKSPTMTTLDVDTYVSDSGYVKYHAKTKIWEVYDDTTSPYWRFPTPLVIDILAPGMKPHAHVECDSAQYQVSKRIFRFDGHVAAVNEAKDTFLTHQLFWDQNKTEFYTDSFIHIVKGDRILEGYGFRSNEKMTDYSILRPTAIIPASVLKREPQDGGETGSQKQNGQPSAQPSAVSSDADDENRDDPLYLPTPVPASQRDRERREREAEEKTPLHATKEIKTLKLNESDNSHEQKPIK